jgi:formiminotetrahydrofolate cyclodeaminase
MLALALLEKVMQLEAQRPSNQGDRQVWEKKLGQIRQLTADLDRLREEDVRAYAQMAQVRATGSQGPEWQEAVEYALAVPREIMDRAREALALVAWAGARCGKHLVSDLQVAREFLGAALQGAYHIARANLPLVADDARLQDFSRKLDQAAQKGRQVFVEAGEVLAGR